MDGFIKAEGGCLRKYKKKGVRKVGRLKVFAVRNLIKIKILLLIRIKGKII